MFSVTIRPRTPFTKVLVNPNREGLDSSLDCNSRNSCIMRDAVIPFFC